MIKLKIKYGNSQTDLRFPCTEKEMSAALERIHAEDVTPLELYVSEVVFPEELSYLQDRFVNLDEVNFLGKRMDSFFGDEEYQFYEAMKLEGFNTLPDLINLSFNLSRYPLIQNIGDMGKIGRGYLLTVKGCLPADDADDPKYAKLGRELVHSGKGVFTEHGLLFVDENTPFVRDYDGQNFPAYVYDQMLCFIRAEYNGKTEFLYLPCEEEAIDKAFARLGAPTPDDVELSWEDICIENEKWTPAGKAKKTLTIAARSFIIHRAPKHRRSVMRICFKHAQVWKDGSLRPADVLVSDGRIVSIGDRVSCSTDTVCIEVHNAVIFPGFVDVHVHLREPGFSYKETIRTGTLAAAHGGFAHVAAMPNLNPVPDCKASLEEELRRIRESACVHVHPYGAISVGQKGEQLADLDAMAPEVIAFSDDGKGVQSESLMREAMEQCRRLGKILAAHCEDNRLLCGGYIHDGAYAKTHSHRGICSESEWGQIARDVRLAEETGCAYHVCHVSTKESVSIIREAKRRGVNVTCETGPHYLTFTEDDLQEDGRFKMNPPLRSREDRDALIEGLLDGTIDMIVTDHAPHSREEKARGLEKSTMGVVGLETSFAACYTSLVKSGVLPLGKLVDLMHDAPMRRFGCGTELAIGQPADLTVFNLSESYVVEPEQFLSMGRATPFAGVTLTGVCKMTMIDGKIVWKEEAL